jgi:centrosomal protein CEP104
MAPPICGEDIPPKVINAAVKPFIHMLIDKIGELNYRARDISLHCLISLFRHPAVDIRQLIEGIMDITEKGPTPDKV